MGLGKRILKPGARIDDWKMSFQKPQQRPLQPLPQRHPLQQLQQPQQLLLLLLQRPLVCFKVPITLDIPVQCPMGFTYFAHTTFCYFVGRTRTNWNGAESMCAAFGANGHLAAIRDDATNTFITGWLRATENIVFLDLASTGTDTTGYTQNTWIGLRRVGNFPYAWSDNGVRVIPGNGDYNRYCGLNDPFFATSCIFVIIFKRDKI